MISMWRLLFLVFLAAALAAAQQLPPLEKIPAAPEQPLPFSHRLHTQQGIACLDCHPTPDPGDFAEIASAEKCMSCHVSVKTESAAIRELTAYHNAGESIPWEPVYLVEDYVYFSHRAHAEQARADCSDYHGAVGERDVLAQERDISMEACMRCHRASGGSLECNYCHEPR